MLRWSHLGRCYQVTAWPDCAFEQEDDGRWQPVEPAPEVLASGALGITAAAWQRYLELVPAPEQAFLTAFGFGRINALLVLARCPSLLPDLAETPALTSFVAAHASLRGSGAPHWGEVTALHERAGVFGLLEWLGLPAARAALEVLRNLVDPDVPRRLLNPLRHALWNPTAATLLRHAPALSDRELARCCHALAA